MEEARLHAERRAGGAPRRASGPTRTQYALVTLTMAAVGLMAVPAPATGPLTKPDPAPVEVELLRSLDRFRAALQAYREDHGTFPGYEPGSPGYRLHGPPDAGCFALQLELASDVWGRTAPRGFGGYPLGPYLRDGIPANPLNGLRTVRLLADGQAFPAAPDAASGSEAVGWVFSPERGELRAAAAGALSTTGEALWEL